MKRLFKMKVFAAIIFFAVMGCSKKDKEDKEKLTVAAIIALTQPKPVVENTCSVTGSTSVIYTKEANKDLIISNGSCFIISKNETSVTQQIEVKTTDPRAVTVNLPTEGKYILQNYKNDKKELISELVIVRKNSVDSPSITPVAADAFRNNSTGEYDTANSIVSFQVVPTEPIQSLFCNQSEFADSAMKSGKPSSFSVSVGVTLTLSCIVTDFAGNSKPLPNIVIKKISESAWLSPSLPNNFNVSEQEIVESCYVGNLSQLSVTAGVIPLPVTVKEDGTLCVNLNVPYGSGTTAMTVTGNNVLGNAYSVTHYITQLTEIQKPVIVYLADNKIRVKKNEAATGTVTEIYIGTIFLNAFNEEEKDFDLNIIAPVGTSIFSTRNTRKGFNSNLTSTAIYRKWQPTGENIVSKVINNHVGNYMPVDSEFTANGYTATSTYDVLPSRPFLLVVFNAPVPFAEGGVQATLRFKTNTFWNTLREDGNLTGVFNNTYKIKYRLYNFFKKSYESPITSEGALQSPVTLSINSECISNNQIKILVEGVENSKVQTGDYWYGWRNYNRCSPPTGSDKITCGYGDHISYNDERGFFCGSYQASCNMRQWIVSSNQVQVPIDDIFAIFE